MVHDLEYLGAHVASAYDHGPGEVWMWSPEGILRTVGFDLRLAACMQATYFNWHFYGPAATVYREMGKLIFGVVRPGMALWILANPWVLPISRGPGSPTPAAGPTVPVPTPVTPVPQPTTTQALPRQSAEVPLLPEDVVVDARRRIDAHKYGEALAVVVRELQIQQRIDPSKCVIRYTASTNHGAGATNTDYTWDQSQALFVPTGPSAG